MAMASEKALWRRRLGALVDDGLAFGAGGGAVADEGLVRDPSPAGLAANVGRAWDQTLAAGRTQGRRRSTKWPTLMKNLEAAAVRERVE
jgi:hypothetical protein